MSLMENLRQWAHPDLDEDDEDMSPYEPTYRDGSAKNECWRDDGD